MSKSLARLTIVILCALLEVVSNPVMRAAAHVPHQATQPVIEIRRVSPERETLRLHEYTTYQINVAQASGANAIQISLHVDPAVLQIVPSGSDGAWLKPGSLFAEGQVLRNEADPSAGTATFIAIVTGVGAEVADSGDVFRITFQTLAAGETPIEVLEGILAVPFYENGIVKSSAEIQAQYQPQVITVGEEFGPVIEPVELRGISILELFVLALSVLALGAAVLIRRRKQVNLGGEGDLVP